MADSALGLLPSDWSAKPLGEVADFVNGRTFKPVDWSENGLPIVRIQNLNGSTEFNRYDGEVRDRFLVFAGDLLFSWSGNRGTSFGPHVWGGPDGILNQHIFNLRNIRGVDREFLFQALKGLTKVIEERAHGGTGIVHITKRELERFVMPVPPLPEQRKIAAILGAVDALIERTQAVIDQVEVVKKGLMQELLTRGLPGRHARFKQTEIGEIPESWEVQPLRDVLREPLRNGYSPRCPDTPNGRWILSLGAVSFSGFVPDAVKPAPPGDDKVESFRLAVGDIVLSRSNTRERVGLAGRYVGEPEWCAYPDLLMRVRPDPGLIDGRFLESALLSDRARSYFSSNARGTSGSMVKLNGKLVGEFLVPLPSLGEQKEIQERIDSVSSRLAAETTELAGLQQLKAGLSSVLLSGEVRVQTNDSEVAA